MLEKLRHYTNLFYYKGNRCPVPVNEFIFQHKSERSIECLKLLAYALYETDLVSHDTLVYLKTGMGYSQLADLTGRNISTIRSSVQNDKTKILSKFGRIDLCITEYTSIVPSVEGYQTTSSLSATERDLMDSCISKLRVYLDYNSVSTEAPSLTEQEQLSNNMLKAVTLYKSVIDKLQSRLDIIDNPNNNEHVKLEDEFSKLLVNYEAMQHQNKSLLANLETETSKREQLSIELHEIQGEYPNLAKLLIPKLVPSTPKVKGKETTAPLRAPELAEALTDYVLSTKKLMDMVSGYSKYDIKAVDRLLGGEQTSYKDVNTEVTRIIRLLWNVDIPKQ